MIEGKIKATWRDRYIAQQSFLILANTGMRVGELRYLRWSDLRTVKIDDATQMIGWVKGKTGAREVVFQPGADEYVKRIYDLRVLELSDSPPLDSYVICHKDGNPVQSFKNSFKSLMDFAKLPLERNGMTRTVYSLRHFFATMRLERETSPYLLANGEIVSPERSWLTLAAIPTSKAATQIREGLRNLAKLTRAADVEDGMTDPREIADFLFGRKLRVKVTRSGAGVNTINRVVAYERAA